MLRAWEPTRCLFVDPKRCGQACADPSKPCGDDTAACAPGTLVRLPEGAACDGLMERRAAGGECVMPEPLCEMQRLSGRPCGEPACRLAAAKALQALQRAKAAEAALAERRDLVEHLRGARQRALDEQESAKRSAAEAEAGLPELETRVRQSVAAVTAAHEGVIAGLPSDEARAAYKARLARAAERAQARLRSSVGVMRDRTQGLQSAAALVDGGGVEAALRRSGNLELRARD